MDKPMMQCGHSANATMNDGKPVCIICYGIDYGADKVADAPDLTGRKAQCTCGKQVPSSLNLAFFEYRTNTYFDSYYCGCRGWN